MFAYCLNNPVRLYDDGGTKAKYEGEPDDEEACFFPDDAADIAAQLQKAANNANAAIEDKGPVAGTQKHTIFATEIRGWNNSRIGVEVSYLDGVKVDYGTKGSIRFDVILYDDDLSTPIMAWDLKTGSAVLSKKRIAQMLEAIGIVIKIFELR